MVIVLALQLFLLSIRRICAHSLEIINIDAFVADESFIVKT
jgi:hypothetical protein